MQNYDKYEKNEHGVPQLPKGHAGRLLVCLAAIDYLERPSVVTISDFTGIHRALIDKAVVALNDQFMTSIVKDGAVFRIVAWGDILSAEGVRKLLTIHFK
ncbi:hypothetical protein NJC40_00080 [Pseudomonas sp. 21LCFQ02]|uniref:hypothetical protein n=1 Tax=Pseudomonas sp. 21LCFQ02 TaxID=2957505 RepID=UPI00209AD1D5|nr:hypothetical protein [Pseudomonas sp. 21LCFQ02]MCO8166180.1 hypothetical protein [Pseudomonas sp. 21LCFQ02]